MRRLFVLLSLLFSSLTGAAAARDITIATWNLGWHMDRATVTDWIEACTATYELDLATKKYRPSISF